MEFAEITEDPFKNTTNNFFLVIDIGRHYVPNTNTVGQYAVGNGILIDRSGFAVGFYDLIQNQDYALAGSLSDEAFAHSYEEKREWILVPPSYTFSQFLRAIGFWLSPKEVEQFILGRLSLKGGD